MIIKGLDNEFREDIKCIPCDKEKYKTFSIPMKYVANKYPIMLKFIDRFNFVNTSLETLVNNLSELFTCNCVDNSMKHIKKNMISTIYTHHVLHVAIRVNKTLNL